MASDFWDTLIIEPETIVNLKSSASYVAKFDPSGNIKWIEHSTCKNYSSPHF
jgi:hypothetical protein